MTAATREAIMEALHRRLIASGVFAVTTRRNVSPETIARPGAPALALLKHHETYKRPNPALPPRRTLNVLAIVYIDVGGAMNLIPDSALNPLQDAVDAALAPDNAATNYCTLGGLVSSVVIEGEVICAPGDKTGKGLAVIPINIIWP